MFRRVMDHDGPMDLWASLRVYELVWKGLNIDVLFVESLQIWLFRHAMILQLSWTTTKSLVFWRHCAAALKLKIVLTRLGK